MRTNPNASYFYYQCKNMNLKQLNIELNFRSDKFVSMATRTRQEYLKDLSTNFVTPTTIDSGNKFGKFIKMFLGVALFLQAWEPICALKLSLLKSTH